MERDRYLNPRTDALGQPLLEDLGDIDVASLWWNLQLTPDQRLEKMERAQAMVVAMMRAGEELRAGGNNHAAAAAQLT
jgi:hypothetical protein